MRILVLGCNGMAGHVISMYLEEKGYIVDRVARKSLLFKETIIMNILDFDALKKLIRSTKYDCVINAVGVLNADAENNHDNAVLINSYLPHFLAKITLGLPTKIIHISTDCVFSGDKGDYCEDDLPDAKTFYGRSKALGELNDTKNLTVRTSIIGPDINENGIGLFHWFMKSRTKKEISGYSSAIWGGVTTIQLAKSIELAMIKKISGLYHLTNGCKISKYNLLQLFKSHFSSTDLNIVKNNDYSTDKSLVTKNCVFDVPSYETMVLDMQKWITNKSELYLYY